MLEQRATESNYKHNERVEDRCKGNLGMNDQGGVVQRPGKEVVEDGLWEQGSVVSQAPEDFAEDFVFFYIAYKDSFEKGRKILIK